MELPIAQADKVEVIQWEKMTNQVNELAFEFGLTPSPTPNNQKGGLGGPNTVLGPMAMTYDPKKGWVIEKLGSRSGHWKRLA